ncbi:hypothetical protein KJ766_01960 [Patescibacteria group bacterium]|nr:hypothetical protein [Patescibacteria group bacterium]
MKSYLLLWIGLAVFFLSTTLLVFGTGGIFNSPDENANYLFAENFSENQSIGFFEPLNLQVGGIITPRSMIVSGARILPGSFLGLPILSGIFGIINKNLIFLLTPALAVFALIAWRQIILFVFKEEKLAILSAVLLAIHPAFWYYSARTMMHNIGFIALLIIGVYFLIVRPIKNIQMSLNLLDSIFAGIFLGLALAFRTSEILWVAIGALVVFFYSCRAKCISLFNILLVIIFGSLTLVPFAFLNRTLYGGALSTGYTAGDSGNVVATEAVSFFHQLYNYIFPFGIHEMNIARSVFNYGFLLYPWMTVLAVLGIGLVLFWYKKEDLQWKVLAICLLLLSAWLAVVYGSWNFHDNPNPLALTIGNSYVRYWLPIFVLSSPFMAKGLLWIADIRIKNIKNIIIGSLLVFCTGLSTYIVFFSTDGIVPTRRALATFQAKKTLVLESTEEDSIVIVDMADKYIFPDRRVVVPLRSQATYSAINEMLEYTKVYYFGITLPDADIDYLNTTILGPEHVYIESRVKSTDETLYEFKIR